MKHTFPFLLAVLVAGGYHHCAARTAAGTASRLVAEVSGAFNAAHVWLPDSTVYGYSAGHGGDYENLQTPYPLKYDSGITWTMDATTLTYKLKQRRTQTFNPANDLLAVQTDQQWSGSAWVYSARTMVHYNTAAQRDTVLSQHYNTAASAWVNFDRLTYTFNGGGYLTASTYDTWSTATNSFTTQVTYQYTLDGSNNRVLELESNYDAASMTMKPGFRVFHHYNGANKELSYAFQQASGASWVNTDSAAYIFNGSNQVVEYVYYTWNAATSAWNKTSHLLETYTATGKVLSEVEQTWNSATGQYTNYDSTHDTYNAADQVQLYHFYSFTTGTNDAETHYYYQQYSPSGVSAPAASMQQELSIWPVPADNVLHITIRLSKPDNLTCLLYDAAGKLLRSWQDASGSIYNRDLSLSGIPAGNYWLRVVSPDGVITKPLAVAHGY